MTKLVTSPRQLEIAEDNKAIGTMSMRPLDFLRLTVDKPLSQWLAYEKDEIRTVAEYNAWAQTKTSSMPTLRVSMETGKVFEHEGRHRAAALLNEKVDTIEVAIILATGEGVNRVYTYYVYDHETYKKTYLGVSSIPDVFRGQFQSSSINVSAEKRTFRSFYARSSLARIELADVRGFAAVLKCEDGTELKWSKTVWVPIDEQDQASAQWNKYVGRFRYSLNDLKVMDRKPRNAIPWRAA